MINEKVKFLLDRQNTHENGILGLQMRQSFDSDINEKINGIIEKLEDDEASYTSRMEHIEQHR